MLREGHSKAGVNTRLSRAQSDLESTGVDVRFAYIDDRGRQNGRHE